MSKQDPFEIMKTNPAAFASANIGFVTAMKREEKNKTITVYWAYAVVIGDCHYTKNFDTKVEANKHRKRFEESVKKCQKMILGQM